MIKKKLLKVDEKRNLSKEVESSPNSTFDGNYLSPIYIMYERESFIYATILFSINSFVPFFPRLFLLELEQQIEVAENRCDTLKQQLGYMKMLYQGVEGMNIVEAQVEGK